MKKSLLTALALAAIGLTAGGAQVTAQSPQAAADAKSAVVQTPLKVTVVISRYQNDKRTSNLPYTFFVNAHPEGGSTNLRMGSQVPVPTTVLGGPGAVQSYNYQNVGMSIDCRAYPREDGRYELRLTVQDSQVMPTAPGTQALGPTIQNFTATNALLLRNGQTVQYTTATDKVSGEVVKIDVTLEVVK